MGEGEQWCKGMPTFMDWNQWKDGGGAGEASPYAGWTTLVTAPDSNKSMLLYPAWMCFLDPLIAELIHKPSYGEENVWVDPIVIDEIATWITAQSPTILKDGMEQPPACELTPPVV